jgi:NTE family protein
MPESVKSINLALQGGGAHGAFTWGVLDRVLEDRRLRIDGLSGTSAGAMNAVALADGIMEGGRDGARAKLKAFWRAVSEAARFSPIRRSPMDVWLGTWSLDMSPGYLVMDALSRVVSPYDFNPLNLNPVRDLIAETVDFARVRSCEQVKVFVSATNVETGRVRVFHRPELTPDAVMASACLPYLFQAVEIDGTPYWDGGFSSNPALFPFAYHCTSPDVVIVQINPIEREGTPTNARDILNRVNEISFNSSLLSELRAISFVGRMVDAGALPTGSYRHLYLHRIHAEEALKPLEASSKLNAEWAFFEHLRDVGRAAAARWLDAHFDALGQRDTLDVRPLLHDDDLRSTGAPVPEDAPDVPDVPRAPDADEAG